MGYELRPGFAAALRHEVAAIMDDPAFCRAPVQSQVFQLLCDRTLEGETRNLSQYAIAIDGLNKPPTFDPMTNSNVRVQISRLRATLEKHYRLFQPSAGLCVYMKLGCYQLRLARVEIAYPKIRIDERESWPSPGRAADLYRSNLKHFMWVISVIAALSGTISSIVVWRLSSYFG